VQGITSANDVQDPRVEHRSFQTGILLLRNTTRRIGVTSSLHPEQVSEWHEIRRIGIIHVNTHKPSFKSIQLVLKLHSDSLLNDLNQKLQLTPGACKQVAPPVRSRGLRTFGRSTRITPPSNMVKVEVDGKPIFEIPCIQGVNKNLKNGTRIRSTTSQSSSKVSWSTTVPRLVVTSDTDDFDEDILSSFREEGFNIWYMPYDGNKQKYNRQLEHLADPLDLGEQYAIVAYGDAAALVLEACMRPMPKLCAVVAYYPPHMPKTSANFPPSLNLIVHLAASQKFGTRHEKSYRYLGTTDGFAESDLEEYSEPDARVAWSRTLAALRKGFGMEPDVEGVVDWHNRLKWTGKKDDVEDLMKSVGRGGSLNHSPTMTGGKGRKDLKRFYSEFFAERNPPDLKTKLLSRTVGSDRVVDEMHIGFTHSMRMEWILPGIPPTGKRVEIVLVTILAVRGGKVYAENVHWDQASVLVQVGLLDPNVIPASFETKEGGQEKEVKRLPVLGAEAARRVADETKGKSNELISEW